MQPQNFLKAINGQAVDPYTCFFCPLTQWKGGQSDLRVSDAELQRCGRKVCACMQCAVPLQLYVGWHRDTDCDVGVVILPDSISLFLSRCHLEVFTFSCCSGLSNSQSSKLFCTDMCLLSSSGGLFVSLNLFL